MPKKEITVAAVVQLIRDKGELRGVDSSPLNQRYCIHLPEHRYIIDFAPDFTAEGWIQFDTRQDAEYFGVWVNPTKLMTLSYAEGDWQLVVCPDAASYNLEIDATCKFHDPAPAAVGISYPESPGGAATVTKFYQDRKECYAVIHPSAQVVHPCPQTDQAESTEVSPHDGVLPERGDDTGDAERHRAGRDGG